VPEGVALDVDQELLEAVDFTKADGLVPAIVQDATDGTVLTMAYMDREALRRTLESGRSWFYSRSRHEYWQKGGPRAIVSTSGSGWIVTAYRSSCSTSTGAAAATPGIGRAFTARSVRALAFRARTESTSPC
jgi:phosphoribosyl-AMP cyclohydrolase